MGNIGLQLYSVREAAEKDLLGTIQQVAEMGYSAAQFAGFSGHTAKLVKSKMDEVGIKAAGAHVQIDQLEKNLDETLKYHDTIGNNLIIVPFLPESMRTTVDDFKRTADLLNKIGKKVHAAGFSLGYHNHNFEFNTFDEKTGFDILYENTDADHLKMELDCFWAAYSGYNPLEIIDKYADRCVSLHIKDMIVEGDTHISTELGKGSLPLADYMKKGKEVGADWFVVEQEHYAKDPLDCAAENAKEIRRLAE